MNSDLSYKQGLQFSWLADMGSIQPLIPNAHVRVEVQAHSLDTKLALKFYMNNFLRIMCHKRMNFSPGVKMVVSVRVLQKNRIYRINLYIEVGLIRMTYSL